MNTMGIDRCHHHFWLQLPMKKKSHQGIFILSHNHHNCNPTNKDNTRTSMDESIPFKFVHSVMDMDKFPNIMFIIYRKSIVQSVIPKVWYHEDHSGDKYNALRNNINDWISPSRFLLYPENKMRNKSTKWITKYEFQNY